MSDASPVVWVVDDDGDARASLSASLKDAGYRVQECTSGQEVLSLPRHRVPCCVLLDVELPDLSGLELQKRIAAERREMQVIFITGCRDIAVSVQAMKAGAFEFLVEPFEPVELLSVVRSALQRSEALLAADAINNILRERQQRLTPREAEVMAFIVAGCLNKNVASDLGISEITVKAHRGRVMRKMQARSLAELVFMVIMLRAASNSDAGLPFLAVSGGGRASSVMRQFSPVLTKTLRPEIQQIGSG